MSDDQSLAQTVSSQTPTSIEEVIAIMNTVDHILTEDDGLKWFNLLYLMATKTCIRHGDVYEQRQHRFQNYAHKK